MPPGATSPQISASAPSRLSVASAAAASAGGSLSDRATTCPPLADGSSAVSAAATSRPVCVTAPPGS